MATPPGSVARSISRRHLAVALATTVAMLVVVPVAALLMPAGTVEWPVLCAALGVAAATGGAMAALPWRKLVKRQSGLMLLYIWLLLDIGAIGAIVAATGGGRSEMWFAYVLTTVFIATGCPPRVQFALMVATLASYGDAVAVAGGSLDASNLLVQVAALIATFALASLPSSELRRESADHRQARRDADSLAEELAAREAWWRALIERASDPVLVLDRLWGVRFASPAFEEALGHSTALVTRTGLSQFVHPEDLEGLRAAFGDGQTPGSCRRVACRLRHRDGTWRHIELVFTDLGDDPNVGGIVANLHDVTDRVEAERALAHQAFHDALTGLPNRALFADRVKESLHRAERSGGSASIVFLDLDNFKEINDSLGHAIGDVLLREVGARLEAATRAEDTLARFGGDEFAVLVNDHEPNTAELVANRLLAALEHPFDLCGGWVLVRASAGLATARKAREASELVRQADVAMYAAKAAGDHGFERYRTELDRAQRESFGPWVVDDPSAARTVPRLDRAAS
jgi:diguanylate cyclase (GGDEF)-like protein/PAS domain S-box-containing protein